MNREELFNYLSIKPKSIMKKKSASIITTENKKYVMKKNSRKADSFDYLLTRNFNNFPKIYSNIDDDIELQDYIEDKQTPLEQKLEDLIYIDSMLHTKTTFYKNIDDDYKKNIYEELMKKQEYLFNYYNELQDMIELEIYMSPANYLLIRNISILYLALRYSRNYLDKWYEIVRNDSKLRFSYIHGNLQQEHLIENDDLYLISWDNSRIDLPIYDLENFYRNNYYDIDLSNMLDIYQSKYTLKKEEYYLLIAHLLIPDKIDMNLTEYQRTKQTTNIILYINKVLGYLENNSNKTSYNT